MGVRMMLDRRRLMAVGAAAALPLAARAASGWSPAGLVAVRAEAQASEIRGLVVLHQGRTVLSYGEPAAVDRIASCRKSFLCTLYGMAQRDRKLDLDQTLAQVGIDDYAK